MQHLSRLLVISAALAVAASSQAILIAGNATGFFTNSTGTVNNGTTLGGLSYLGSAFSSTTNSSGFYTIGGTSFLDSMGQFTLSNLPTDYAGKYFLLRLTFSSPAGTSPNPASMVTSLLGRVEADGSGGARVSFGNTAVFTFTNGSFDLTVNRVSITPGQALFVNGDGTARVTGVPGPSALAAFGLSALAGIRRRRRSA